MVKLMTIDELVKIAACVGIVLEPVDDVQRENLYVYATKDEQHIVYVGKNEAQSKRSREYIETVLSTADYKNFTESGFAALIQENNAKRHSFRYDPAAFDPTMLRSHVDRWYNITIDRIKEEIDGGTFSLSVAEVERILIRMHVCTGRLIGNSHNAGQWEANVAERHNYIAVIAADVARAAGILPEDTVLAVGESAEDSSDESVVVTQ